MRRKAGGAAVLLLLLAAAVGHAQTRTDCAGLRAYTSTALRLEIHRATEVPAGPAAAAGRPGAALDLPAHCLVEGDLERRAGVGGTEYAIGFALALPDRWNGRFLFQGGGGLNGTVRPPIGAQAAGDRAALARGFAVVSTDSGHKGAVFDGRFLEDQEAALDFLYLAVGKVTRAAKQLVAAYYGRPAEHAYFVGCSTGGREAMIASERYPEDFDGIVAGSPAMRTGYSNLGMRSAAVALNGLAAKDEHGAPVPGTGLTAGDKQLIVDRVLEDCDAKDGVEDGMIFDRADCRFDPDELVCGAQQTSQCLTARQAAAVKKALAGPVDANGDRVYPGYPYDTGIAATGRGVIPGVLNGAPSPVDPPVPPTHQDVDAEAVAAAGQISSLGYTRAWTNLSTFREHGGKLLFYHGLSDPWFSALDTVGYYEDLGKANGGRDAVEGWSRLFLVPGMGHCAGGKAALDRFDMLTAVVDWVEKGKAPDSVVATGAAFPGRSRPLCAYPQHAQYTGRGDPEEASSYECER